MKEQSQKKPSRTDGGKTELNAIETPSISLPKGGGAIKGIDEKFSVNAVNGTAAFSIPLPVAQARGAVPSLSVSYNSGAGNAIFGLGWNLSIGSIKRKTDKELPQYIDVIDSDTFMFSEAEDLVPEYRKNPDGAFLKDGDDEYLFNERISSDGLFVVRMYRPRIEGLFARIERWTEKATGRMKWRVITGDNSCTLFGWTDNAVLSFPDAPNKIYEWLPEFVFDDKGNCAHYIYKKEDDTGFDKGSLHNRNRWKTEAITYTNRYLEKALYGNRKPYKKFNDPFPSESDYLFQTVFDYGTTDIETESPEAIHAWDFRQDAFSDYKAGFEIRTTRLCKRVLLFHVFDELAVKQDKSDRKTLVSSVNFAYDTSSEQDFTFLKSVTSYGYIKKSDGTYSFKKLPSMEFGYQKHEWCREVKTIAPHDLVHAPVGLDEQLYQFTDLFNEGLPGILTEQVNGWYYKHNLGDGKFEQAKCVSPKPSFAGLGAQLQLMDLDADGGKQLVSFDAVPKGFFELDDNNEWQGLRSFKTMPNIPFGDANTRMLDLNGDGRAEVVISEDNVFTWYPSEGREGFAPARKSLKPIDGEEGPHIVFADAKQTIYLADMSGGGMTDIVRIRNGEVCYWPNLGYGKFGAKITMDNAPVFDHPDAFNPSYLRLADIDGSGTSDIIYLGKNRFTCWKNLSGNRFSATPFEIDPFPEIHDHAKVTVTDLLGNGVACIVWSSPLSKDARCPIKYIDLMNGKKPHVMVFYKNNLGKEVSMEYTPSTQFYIEDKLAGKPWVTKLHFPVHCVSKTITKDIISGYQFVSQYRYHHGYYDHQEREFRGFGMVEQTDAETFEHWKKVDASNVTEEPLHQEPVVSKAWCHTGAFLQKDNILNQFEKDYWFAEMQRQGVDVTHHEMALPDARLITAPGLDPDLINRLSGEEWREAFRACKGMALRTETFAKDAVNFGNTEEARKKELTPFSVATHNCVIELLQPKGRNKHAVFVVKESEAITYSYERNPTDPRIAHTLNVKLDEYGNVLESAAVVYPRKTADGSLPLVTQQEQAKTVVIYTQNDFTNDLFDDDTYRTRLPSQVKTFELKGVRKSGDYYSPADFVEIVSDEKTDTALYHELDKPLIAGKAQKRVIEHVVSTYYDNNLTGALPLHCLESLAIPFESYYLAYTPELVADIFGNKVDETLLKEGKFTAHEEDGNWWIRSGTIQYKTATETKADAQERFYCPVSYTDPYGGVTRVKYGGDYFLFINETEDVLGNRSSVDLFNFRTLSPQRMKDINGNLSQAISDELGIVKVIAVMGKGDQADDLDGLLEMTEADESTTIDHFFNAPDSNELTRIAKSLLNHATTRFVYDMDACFTSGKPTVIAAISREQHYRNPDGSLAPDSPLQISFEYSNGIGEVVMQKAQATRLRWIGNGRTIKNNKGNVVKQYEPYFSVDWRYEDYKELAETGVTPIMYYDAPGRLIKTEMPDGTFSEVEFDSWKQSVYDANDTILESPWYLNRVNRLIDAQLIADGKDPVKEKTAALKAAAHANTPNILHFDTLGRPVLSIELTFHTKVTLDAENNLRSVNDARGNTVMTYKYDMLGNVVYQKSMDAGQRWLLTNILGKPLRTWDERDHEFQYFYDQAQRPVYSKVLGGDGETPLDHIFEKVIYGENLLSGTRTETNRWDEADLQTKNILGQPIKLYDTAGLVETPEYDFKGQPISTTRSLFKRYKEVPDWKDEDGTANLESDKFTFHTLTDALGRIINQTAPDGSIITPSYNETGLLNGEKVKHVGQDSEVAYIKDIDYNEKGQREKIIYGNDVSTRYFYDKETFRLKRLESKRKEGTALQDWRYTYDPVGNITHIEDKIVETEFFNNQSITGEATYTYDPLYRLIEATGKENAAAIHFGSQDNWNDQPFMHDLDFRDPLAVRNYTQRYQYDAVGNIIQMKHIASGGSWTRNYEYCDSNNRLTRTSIGDTDNPENYTNYQHHDRHGFLVELPHLAKIGWNFKEEIVLTSRQHCTGGNIPETTYYQYDGSGQRIRKITENQTSAGGTPTKKEERIYIAGYERYKKYSGTHAELERTTLSLMDAGHRFVMIETRNEINDDTEKQLVRYQLHNHLGSAALELDDHAQIISYEEYHPFGTTAYQAKNQDIKSAAKRYRYTGMERDEETGLEYHSARYYAPWLGRWMNADPIGIGDGVNVYGYAHGNPVSLHDTNGMNTPESDADKEIMMMTDSQLRKHIEGMSAKDRVSFANNATGWFNKRAWATINKYANSRLFYDPSIEGGKKAVEKMRDQLSEEDISARIVPLGTYREFVTAWNNMPYRSEFVGIISHARDENTMRFPNDDLVSSQQIERDLNDKNIPTIFLGICNSGIGDDDFNTPFLANAFLRIPAVESVVAPNDYLQSKTLRDNRIRRIVDVQFNTLRVAHEQERGVFYLTNNDGERIQRQILFRGGEIFNMSSLIRSVRDLRQSDAQRLQQEIERIMEQDRTPVMPFISY